MNKRRIKLIVIWFVVVVVIVGGIPFVLWLSLSDGSPPDVSDLMPQRSPIPDSENGFALLRGDVPLKWDNSIQTSSWGEYKKSDQLKVDALLAQNEGALELFDKAMALPGFQFEKMESFEQKFGYLTFLQRLARLKSHLALKHWDSGQQHEALEENFQVIELGHRVENGGGVLIHFLVGVSIEAMALKNLPHFISGASVSEREEIKDALAKLEPYENHTGSFSNAMKCEFTIWKNLLDDIATGRRKLSGFQGIFKGTNPGFLQMAFQPNNSLAMFAATFRQMIHDAPLSYDKIDLKPGPMKTFARMSLWTKIISPNYTGRCLYMIAVPVFPSTESKKCRVATQFAMARTLIATRLYWLDKGKLPATLDELVPAYLKSVPIDAYDGKPLRYSLANKVIYSVGKDLADRGGDLSDGNSERDKQPTVKIEW